MEKIINILNQNRGETLVEVVVSIAILAILSTAMVCLLISSSNMNNQARKVSKENADIAAKIDGTDTAGIVSTTVNTTPGTEFIITLTASDGTTKSIKSEGKYETVKGNSGPNMVVKQFVPN